MMLIASDRWRWWSINDNSDFDLMIDGKNSYYTLLCLDLAGSDHCARQSIGAAGLHVVWDSPPHSRYSVLCLDLAGSLSWPWRIWLLCKQDQISSTLSWFCRVWLLCKAACRCCWTPCCVPVDPSWLSLTRCQAWTDAPRPPMLARWTEWPTSCQGFERPQQCCGPLLHHSDMLQLHLLKLLSRDKQALALQEITVVHFLCVCAVILSCHNGNPCGWAGCGIVRDHCHSLSLCFHSDFDDGQAQILSSGFLFGPQWKQMC